MTLNMSFTLYICCKYIIFCKTLKFYLYMCCLFAFLVVIFDEKIFLILTYLDLSVFPFMASAFISYFIIFYNHEI